MAKSSDRLVFFSCLECWYLSVPNNLLPLPKLMAAAGPLSRFISALVLDCSITILSENRHLGRASINGGGFIPNSHLGNS